MNRLSGAAHLSKLLIFFVLAAFSVLILMPLQDSLDSYMAELKTRSIEGLEERIGRELVYEKISPSILMSFDIRNLSIAPFNNNRPENIHIGRLQIFYSPIQLLRGKTVDAVKSIRIDNTDVRIDRQKDEEFIRFLRRFFTGPELPDESVPGGGSGPGIRSGRDTEETGFRFPGISLQGRNISLHYIDGERSYDLEKLSFRVRHEEDDELPLRVDAEGELTAELDKPVGPEPMQIVRGASEFSMQAAAGESLQSVSSTVSLRNFSTNLFSFRRLTLELERDRERTVVRKIEDSSPWDLSLTYTAPNGELLIDFAAEEFAFTDNIETSSELSPLDAWLSTKLTGASTVSLSLEEEEFSYTADLRAEVDNRYVPEPFTADFEVKGTEREADFEILRIGSDSVDLEYRGTVDLPTLFPDGRLVVNRLSIGDHVLRTTLEINESNRNIELYSSVLLVDSTLLLKDLSLSGRLEENRLSYRADFSIGRHNGEASYYSGTNLLETEGTLELGAEPAIEASIEIRSAPLLPILETFFVNFPIEESPLAGLTISTNAFVSTDFSSFLFSLQPFELLDSHSDFRIRAKAQGNNERIRLSEFTGNYRGYELTGISTIRLDEAEMLRFDTLFRLRAEEYRINGTFYRNSTLILRGNHGVSGTVFFQGDNIAFSGSLEDFPIPLEEQTMEISLKGRGRISGRRGWNAHLSTFSINAPPGLPEEGRFSLSATANAERIKLWNIRYRDATSELKGQGWFSPKTLYPLEGNGWLKLSGKEEESYHSVVSLSAERIDASLKLSSAPLDRWKEMPVQGLLGGNFHFYGSIDDPTLDFSAQIENGIYENSPFEIETHGSIDESAVSLSYLRGSYMTHILQKGEGFYDVNSGEIRIKGQYRGTFGEKAASTLFSIRGEVAAVESLYSVSKISEHDYRATASLENIQLLGVQREPWEIRMRKEEDTLSLEGGPENAVSAVFSEAGAYRVEIADPLPVRLVSTGKVEGGQISSRISDIFVDLSALRELGFSQILFPSGRITGDFRIEGSFSDPEFYGMLNGENISATLQQVAEPIEPFSTSISFNEKECIIEPVRIKAGEGRALLSGGFFFDRWTPSDIRVDVSTVGDTGIRSILRIEGSGLYIDGYGLGDFSVIVQENMTRIEGDLRIKDCVITLEDKTVSHATDEMAAAIVVDMQIETGPRVEFLWPRQQFPILSAYMDTGQNVSIYYNSLDDRFRLTGEVGIKGGEVYYFQRSFYLKEGTITFNETEESFNPLLNARAEIKEIDMTGHPVTISLIVDNEPLKSFTPRFESNPQLSTVEIAQILGTNIYGPPGEQQLNLASALLLTGDIFSQFSVVRSFENQVKEAFNLDLFSLRTQLVQNVILDRVSREDVQTTEENIRQTDPLDRYLDNTTLFLGKYLGNDLFLEAMLQIRQRPTYVGELQDEELDFSMEVGLEWKTPLFLLNLSVTPDFTDPQESLKNTRFGLSWDYSYK